jgi:hypothetical protein
VPRVIERPVVQEVEVVVPVKNIIQQPVDIVRIVGNYVERPVEVPMPREVVVLEDVIYEISHE